MCGMLVFRRTRDKDGARKKDERSGGSWSRSLKSGEFRRRRRGGRSRSTVNDLANSSIIDINITHTHTDIYVHSDYTVHTYTDTQKRKSIMIDE